MSEDCLHLTVTAPAQAIREKSKIPVLVFLHGGANVSGGGDLDCYLPQSLVDKGIVIVNVTYRLGIFGWVPIEGVAPANIGLLDQIEALRWVQRNISSIGGDPQQVTVSGHSVGAYAIYCMMIADDAAGLFQQAILQSTPFGWQIVPKTVSDKVSRMARQVIQGDPLRLSTEELLELQMKLIPETRALGLPRTFAWAHFGKYPLPDSSEVSHRIQEAAGKYSILITWAKNESVAFVPMLQHYSAWADLPLIGGVLKDLAAWWYSQSEFIWPSQRFHKEILQAGGKSSSICFSWAPPRSPFGAVHCIELPLILGSWGAWETAPMLEGPDSEKVVKRLGQHVKNIWAAFIYGTDAVSGHFEVNEDFDFKP